MGNAASICEIKKTDSFESNAELILKYQNHCGACNTPNTDYVNTICDITLTKFQPVIKTIIKSYIPSDNIVIFHSNMGEGYHRICDSCFNRIENIALMCDTNMVGCPIDGCKRTVFLAP
jgi:hypothetical protein